MTTPTRFHYDQPVFARLSGYPFWPARVVSGDNIRLSQDEEDETLCEGEELVMFFNDDGRCAKVHHCRLRPLGDGSLVNGYNGPLRAALRKAVADARKYVSDHGWEKVPTGATSRKRGRGGASSGRGSKRVKQRVACGCGGGDVVSEEMSSCMEVRRTRGGEGQARVERVVESEKEDSGDGGDGEIGVMGKAMDAFVEVVRDYESGVETYYEMSGEELLALVLARDIEVRARKRVRNGYGRLEKTELAALVVARDIEIGQLSK